MDNIHKLIFAFFLFFSCQVFADTYPAERHILFLWPNNSWVTDQSQACTGQNSSSYTYVVASTVSPYTCLRTAISNGSTTYVTLSTQWSSYVCNYGGTVSGSSCINAPACVAPAVRDQVTGACWTNPCVYPEVHNSVSNSCEMPECTSTNQWNYITNQCDTPPICGAYEQFINSPTKFGCQISSITCPGHSHSNQAMDACLPDAPFTCTTGYHDDGTYHCVSDTPHACGTDEVKGYVNGKPVCAKKTETSQTSADADKAAAAASTAAAAAETAAAASAAASAAAAADPGNQSLQDAATAAATTAAAAASELDQKVAADKEAQSDSDSAALRSIAENTQEADDRAKSRDATASSDCGTPPVCTGDAVDCAVLQQLFSNGCDTIPSLATGDVPAAESLSETAVGTSSLSYSSVGGDCPAPIQLTIQGQSMSVSYDFICQYAMAIKTMVILVSLLSAGYILFSTKGA